MSTTSQDQTPLDELGVADSANFQQGPPLELFRRLRAECPVHWSSGIAEFPDEAGFWSVTTAEDVFEVSRDWQTYSSEVGGFTASNAGLSLEMQQAMFIGMDPPKHDRLKALFQRGFTPKRIAEHEDAIRAITIDVLERLEGPPARETCDLVSDVAQPVVARVIGSFMGLAPEDDQAPAASALAWSNRVLITASSFGFTASIRPMAASTSSAGLASPVRTSSACAVASSHVDSVINRTLLGCARIP